MQHGVIMWHASTDLDLNKLVNIQLSGTRAAFFNAVNPEDIGSGRLNLRVVANDVSEFTVLKLVDLPSIETAALVFVGEEETVTILQRLERDKKRDKI